MVMPALTIVLLGLTITFTRGLPPLDIAVIMFYQRNEWVKCKEKSHYGQEQEHVCHDEETDSHL